MVVVLGWGGRRERGLRAFCPLWPDGAGGLVLESITGFTTTGASSVRVPEEVAPSLLFWRSLAQWRAE